MTLTSRVKDVAIASGVYGPLRRNVRRFFQPASRDRFIREVEFYSGLISPGDLCFDVGANIGAKSEVFLALGAKVVAFEPQPLCLRELRARCGNSDRLVTVGSAVGAQPGRAKLFLNGHSGVASLVAGWTTQGRAGEIDVPVTTLDHAIQSVGLPRFCKIDVEGFELQVLQGLSQPISTFSLEYHLTDDDVAKTFACLDRLSRFGELSLNISFAEHPAFVWSDWVSLSQFSALFPASAPRNAHYDYGDLFVRVAPS
jgi:FkbM family methyltransferase